MSLNEIRIAVLGNVDSGKSTLIGVLTKNIMDNGKGLARENIIRHRHEKETGRTSTSSHYFYKTKKSYITFIDLAGHEKYLKTTLRGVTGSFIDYTIIVIGSNMGISKMTKEHLGIAITLEKPILIILTKVDICPKHILKETKDKINKILKKNNKMKWDIKNENDLEKMYDLFKDTNYISPIFTISNVTGFNINLLKNFFEKIESRYDWNNYKKNQL